MTGLNSSRDAPVQDGFPMPPITSLTKQELLLLIAEEVKKINKTLKEMKEQEKQYWETWRQAKQKEDTA